MREEYPLVLLGAPTNSVKDYCQKEWISQVKNLNYPNYKIFLSDNSIIDDFSKSIIAQGIECGRVNPIGKSNPQYMAESHEQVRKKAIEIGAEFILHWEVDLFTDNKDIIFDLLNARKSVVGAIYHIEQGEKSHLCILPMYQQHYMEPISVTPLRNGMDLQFVDGSLKQVFSCGLGCVSIHRSVFEKIKFRYDTNESYHPDSSFAEDCQCAGIKIFADTSMLMDHKNQKWLMYN